MIALGIDPGLRRTGYAFVSSGENGDSSTLLEAGCFQLNPRRSIPIRLKELEGDLQAALSRRVPEIVCVESLFSHYAHPRTAIVMAHARGVVLLVAARAGLPVLELPPAEIKKSVAGHGRAAKQQIQEAVAALLSLPEPPNPSDVADAIAIAVCGSRRAEFAGSHLESLARPSGLLRRLRSACHE